MEKNEMIEALDDKEPVYFVPKRVSLVSDVAGVISWVVLGGFLTYMVVQVINLQSQMKSGNLVFSTLVKQPSFISYLFTNLAIPLITGVALFAILQAAAAGLNVLLEMDFNSREAKTK
jgi:hypothetical protein